MNIKQFVFILGFSLFTFQGFSQFEVGGSFATSLYAGNLSKTPFIIDEAKPAGTIFGRYYLAEKIAVGGSLSFGKITGDDLNKESSYVRNLRFESPIFEVAALGTYDILNQNNYNIVPYVHAGVALFHHNPKTEDLDGVMVELQPLGTEGQGLPGYHEKYSLWNLAIPFGGGVKYKINEAFSIHGDFTARKTFTEYLDDIGSRLYAVPSELLAGNGQTAYDLAYRAGEIPVAGEYPGTGIQYEELEDPAIRNQVLRSTTDAKDWYYFIGVGGSFFFSDQTKSKIPRNRKHVPYDYNRN